MSTVYMWIVTIIVRKHTLLSPAFVFVRLLPNKNVSLQY